MSKPWRMYCDDFLDTSVEDYFEAMNDPNKRQIFMCSLCGNTYAWSSSLRRHQLQCGNKEAKIKCGFCSKRFYRRDRLKEHLYVHHSNLNSECEACKHHNDVDNSFLMDDFSGEDLNTNEFDFASVPLLQGRHVPLQEQRYMCGECGKGYKWMDNLRRHQRLECGQLPKLSCSICSKKFYRRYELTKHMRMKHHLERREI
ncbi:zinc finger protein 431-like [Pseudomyrmex gracilis]|uniref:zinc finger protein 431-like n=1 Tax=Pseudomyrmex gracilis TaxID=219809 RepID=UPI0009958666|nr:zinc finger protein 431-like [Pseudomyrmex gracilis]